jgi:hypothetical protein
MWVELTDQWKEGWVICKDGFQHYAITTDGKATDKRFGYKIEIHKVWE